MSPRPRPPAPDAEPRRPRHRRARLRAGADDADPDAGRAHARELDTDASGDRLGADGLPARRRRRDAGRRPARRHVRQAPAVRHLAARLRAPATSSPRSAARSRSSWPAACCRASAAASSRSLSAIIRDEFPREQVPGSIGLISAIFGIGGGLGLSPAACSPTTLSYHWIFWLGAAVAARRRDRRASCSCPSRPSGRPGGSTCAARRCSPPASCRRCSPSRARTLGLGQRAHDRPDRCVGARRARRCSSRVERRTRAAARRHPRARRAARADDEHRRRCSSASACSAPSS